MTLEDKIAKKREELAEEARRKKEDLKRKTAEERTKAEDIIAGFFASGASKFRSADGVDVLNLADRHGIELTSEQIKYCLRHTSGSEEARYLSTIARGYEKVGDKVNAEKYEKKAERQASVEEAKRVVDGIYQAYG
jgi:hypothetical protein